MDKIIHAESQSARELRETWEDLCKQGFIRGPNAQLAESVLAELATCQAERDAVFKESQSRTVEASKLISELVSERNAAQAACAQKDEALRWGIELLNHANKGAFDNGVKDQSGTIDEGEVAANRIYEDMKKALSSTCGTGYVRVSELEPIRVAVEYLGCHEHTSHKSSVMKCAFCETVDKTLTRLEALKGAKA